MSPALLEALQAVRVAPDGLSATVGDREVEADNPREMRRLLSEALYQVLHAGQPDGKSALPLRIREPEFERQLDQAVPHRETVVPVKVCSPPEPDGKNGRRLLVLRDAIRVWVPETALRGAADAAPGDVVDIAVPSRRPALSPGFFLVDGSRYRRLGNETLRCYVHLTDPEKAIAIWARVLEYLEGAGVVYRAKVLSARELYPRRDSLVVYLDPEFSAAAMGVADAVRGLAGVGAETSAFTERLAEGVATAWEPTDSGPGMRGLSFGQHRATVLADALLTNRPQDAQLERTIAEKFTAAGIDPAAPARNTNSD
ncbi:T3SS effector HopA1 family protein [Kitasatospora sp. HPMI-4]|uniref:T3SS effector HopA1 family protein n=1 Tax=Kitasatospora sp. HPMI-4 TaxID=3448443 RepID=UPI003F1BC559